MVGDSTVGSFVVSRVFRKPCKSQSLSSGQRTLRFPVFFTSDLPEDNIVFFSPEWGNQGFCQALGDNEEVLKTEPVKSLTNTFHFFLSFNMFRGSIYCFSANMTNCVFPLINFKRKKKIDAGWYNINDNRILFYGCSTRLTVTKNR